MKTNHYKAQEGMTYQRNIDGTDDVIKNYTEVADPEYIPEDKEMEGK